MQGEAAQARGTRTESAAGTFQQGEAAQGSGWSPQGELGR